MPRKLATAVAGLVVFAVVAVVLVRGKQPRNTLLVILAILVAVSMVAMVLMLLAGQEPSALPRRFLVASEQCIEVFVWLVLLDAVRTRGTHPLWAFGLYLLAVVALPWVLSFDLFYLGGVAALVPGRDVLMPGITVALLIAAFAVGGCLLLCALSPASVPAASVGAAPTPADRADSRRVLVGATLRDVDVTPRELEVMVLVNCGYSARRIAETLHLSEQTVKSYTSRVYHKLGVHSKQEFLTLVDARASQP